MNKLKEQFDTGKELYAVGIIFLITGIMAFLITCIDQPTLSAEFENSQLVIEGLYYSSISALFKRISPVLLLIGGAYLIIGRYFSPHKYQIRIIKILAVVVSICICLLTAEYYYNPSKYNDQNSSITGYRVGMISFGFIALSLWLFINTKILLKRK